MANLTGMFTDVNTKVGGIAADVGKTPGAWSPAIFNLVKAISDNVAVPIAGMVISFVLVYELISMVIDKNNMKDFDTSLFIRFIMKACIAVMLLSRSFEITMAVFDVGQYVVGKAGALITGSTSINVGTALESMYQSQIGSMGIGELIRLGVETGLASFCMVAISVVITVILNVRMVEIYCYISVAPIPAATVTNREWGTIGTNYLKGLIALAFQGFFIMICVGIYSVLVQGITVATDIHAALWNVMAYTIVLCFSLIKTGGLSRSIFHAH